MALGGTVILLVPLILIAAITFFNSSRILEDLSKTRSVQLAQSLARTIHIDLEKNLHILDAIAADPLVVDKVSKKEFDRLNEKLTDLYAKIGIDYEGLSVIDQAGIVSAEGTDRTKIGISVADREYVRIAREGKTGIGPVTASKATGQPVFGICAPIMSPEGRFLGGALGVVKADFLMRHIASLQLGQTGYAFMLDQNGILIAHPIKEFILALDTTKHEELEKIARRMIRQEIGTGEYTYQGTEKITGFAPVASTGWSIGVTQDRQEVMALAYANRNLILLASGFFLLLTILAILFFSRTVSAPVQKTLATLNQAIDQAAEAIAIIGLDRRVQFVNPAMAAIFDRPIQGFIGRELPMGNLGPNEREKIWKHLEQGTSWNGCITDTRKNGPFFSLELTLTPVRDASGKIDCFLAVGRDISQELLMEAQLRQSQKMEAIGTLAGGIAHDFNNILSAVFGYAELTLAHLADQERSKYYMKEILKAAGRARDLVMQIMTFSRQAPQQKQLLKPKPIIKEALKLLRASLPATIEIQAALNSDATIMADPTQIHQIMMNLCANAGYAMKEKGGILEILLDEVVVDPAFSLQYQGLKPGRYLMWKVSDSGSGIPSEIVGSIFDPFFTTKPQGEGTGLGLSVVHGIVKAMDGSISVASTVGKGSSFSIYLPVSDLEAQQVEGDTHEEVPRGSECLLLVDDEAAIVQTEKGMLEDLGYRVTGFTDSTAALERFAGAPRDFDAVITDCTMPRLNGYELARRIREIRNDIPILMCSGHTDKKVELEIREAGIAIFLLKPITMRDMAVALRRTLDDSTEIPPSQIE